MLGFLSAGALADEPRFPFVIPGDDASDSITSMAGLSPRAAGADGFVRVHDAHFFTDAGRLRLWGVNLTFSANFPEHADADRLAAHLAKLGVNAVRLHHHDTANAPRGLWGPVVNGHRPLDPQQVDRLDYLLAALHRHGIYADLNLHVGREVSAAEGMSREGLPYATRYDKYLLYFVPQPQEKLKEFCREYLLHENPYRKLRRVDDPGVAIVEITNENSFSKLGPEVAADLPEPYRGEFKRQWNAWLGGHYANTAAMQKAWSVGDEPLGETLLDPARVTRSGAPWQVKQSKAFPVAVSYGQPGPQAPDEAMRVVPQGTATEVSAQELHWLNLTLEPGKLYTVSFWIKADGPRTLHVDLSNPGPGNWTALGYVETLALTTEWQHISRSFRATASSSGKARFCLKFGGSATPFTLAEVSLRRGAEPFHLAEGQTLEAHTVGIPVRGWPEAARADAHQFMVDTERTFLAGMVAFLKKDLGVRVPITDSQLTYNPPDVIAATCDYADIHSYWQHPHFPHKPWDPVDWTIKNTPMEAAPEGSMIERATWRLLDRPFTMSEWNIPDPNDYAASVVPFAAMIAALQDWDGVFFFQYAGGDGGWTPDGIQRFFSFNGQPVKLALLTACANLYRRGDLAPLSTVSAGTFTERPAASLALTARIGIDPAGHASASPPTSSDKLLASPDGRARWDARDPARAHVLVNSPQTRAVWGLIGNQQFDLGGISATIGAVERNYAVLVLTSSDGLPLERSRRALLVAVGSAENIGYEWNASRTSVGKHWGHGPAQVNAVPVTITFPRLGARVYALDGTGQRLGELTHEASDTGSTFRLGSSAQTLWYEIEW